MMKRARPRYAEGMYFRPDAILVLCAIGVRCLLSTPQVANSQKLPENKAAEAISEIKAHQPSPASNQTQTSHNFTQPEALTPLFEQLYLLSEDLDSTPVHILHFGDSHSAADEWTADLRHIFKERFGDGGSGFSVAGRQSGYHRFDVEGGGSGGWRSDSSRSGAGDGYFGLGGIAISTQSEGQSVFIDTRCNHLEIHFLQQPGGGEVALYDHDQLQERFTTKGDLGPGYVSYQIAPGEHRFLLRTLNSRPVRLFGWVADKATGVTYEPFGINGAEASLILRWNEAAFATYLARRSPKLIVLAYGTNEGVIGSWRTEKYQSMFSEVLQRLHSSAPEASILVVGPPDSWVKNQGTWRPVPGIDRVIAAQKSACKEHGCSFWDTRENMGGVGSMRRWVEEGLAQHDHIHFTPSGYRRLASMLSTDLMASYELFKKVRLEISAKASHP